LATSTDNGISWTNELVPGQPSNNTYSQNSPIIATDSQDNIHLIWTGLGWGVNINKFNLVWKIKRKDTGWQTERLISDSDKNSVDPSMAINSKDSLQIIWYRGAALVYTNSNFIDSGQDPVNTGGYNYGGGVWPAMNGAIAVDHMDRVHLAGRFYDAPINNFPIGYTTGLENGQFDSWQRITDISSPQLRVSIAVDSYEEAHMAGSSPIVLRFNILIVDYGLNGLIPHLISPKW
jgi:hypothetical protein